MDIFKIMSGPPDGEKDEASLGYQARQQPPALPVVLNRQAQSPLPIRVALAMRFIEMCNAHAHPKGFMVGNPSDGVVSAEVRVPELPGTQDAALRFACKCLGDFFAGKEIPLEQWES